MPNRD